MRFTKIAGVAVCAALIIAVLAGCQQKAQSPFVSPDISPSASASAAAGAPALNIEAADKAFAPETVMLTANGRDVTWDELFYFVNYSIKQIQADGGQITSWSSPYQEDVTYKDHVLNTAVSMILQNAAIEYGAKQQNVALTPKDQEAIQNDWKTQAESAGSEEAFIAQLQAEYCSKDIFMYMENLDYLVQGSFRAIYGDMGDKLSDQDIADYTAEDGYLMAKHILMLTNNTDESGNETPMTDAEKAVVKEKMEDILNQLKAYSGTDFNAFFDQVMNEYSADKGGLASFPNGYLFQSGDMVSQFYDGTLALKIGEFSPELVETEYGYHIIYRLPLNYDVTPMKYSNYGEYSLRFITANQMFNANIATWQGSLSVTYSDLYKTLDFNKIFAAG